MTILDLLSSRGVARAREALDRAKSGGQRHAFLLGAVHHWLACVVVPGGCGGGGSQKAQILLCDSDNKPFTDVLSCDGLEGEGPLGDLAEAFANEKLDVWRESCRERQRRADPALQHVPDAVSRPMRETQ